MTNKAHETRGYNDGLWQTYNGHSLDGDARDAYDVGYEQGCEEYDGLRAFRDALGQGAADRLAEDLAVERFTRGGAS